jgi:hypothetical protein
MTKPLQEQAVGLAASCVFILDSQTLLVLKVVGDPIPLLGLEKSKLIGRIFFRQMPEEIRRDVSRALLAKVRSHREGCPLDLQVHWAENVKGIRIRGFASDPEAQPQGSIRVELFQASSIIAA